MVILILTPSLVNLLMLWPEIYLSVNLGVIKYSLLATSRVKFKFQIADNHLGVFLSSFIILLILVGKPNNHQLVEG